MTANNVSTKPFTITRVYSAPRESVWKAWTERDAFEGMFASMQQGFGGTFDQLEAYLAKHSASENAS